MLIRLLLIFVLFFCGCTSTPREYDKTLITDDINKIEKHLNEAERHVDKALGKLK